MTDPQTIKIEPEWVQWAARTMDSVKTGGVWAIPRSGMVYLKSNEATLRLTSRMPWLPGMPVSQADLDAQQRHQHALNQRVFKRIGVTVLPKEIQ